MKHIKFPLELRWIGYAIQHSFKRSCMPKQLTAVADDPSSLPEYQRQVRFLKENHIEEPYECFQCRSFDTEIDGCRTPYEKLYCGVQRRDRMCPGFDPPENGKFGFVVSEVNKA